MTLEFDITIVDNNIYIDNKYSSIKIEFTEILSCVNIIEETLSIYYIDNDSNKINIIATESIDPILSLYSIDPCCRFSVYEDILYLILLYYSEYEGCWLWDNGDVLLWDSGEPINT